MFVGSRALKWDNKSSGVILIATAPEWKVRGYNTSSHKYYEFEREEVSQLILGNQSEFHRGNPPADLKGNFNGVVRGGERQIVGHKCVEYIYPKRISTRYDAKEARHFRDSAADKSDYGPLTGQRKEIWYATDITFPTAMSKLLSSYTNASVNFPLLSVHYRQRGAQLVRSEDFETQEIKRVKFKPSDYEAPKGYAKAASQMALLFNEGSADEILMLKDIGEDKKSAQTKVK